VPPSLQRISWFVSHSLQLLSCSSYGFAVTSILCRPSWSPPLIERELIDAAYDSRFLLT
jgi:hypothetical protein